jgi:DNA polymerase III delta subunit
MASAYVDKQYVLEFLEEYKNDVEKYEYRMEDIKDFDIEFMGEGKLVRLINRSQRPKLRGGSVLLLTYGSNSSCMIFIIYSYEGRDLAKQGFMIVEVKQ